MFNKKFKISLKLFFTFVFFSLIFYSSNNLKALNILQYEAKEYFQKAYLHKQRGEIDKAIQYYQKAILLDSSYVPVYNSLGILYEKKGLPRRAEQMYLKAIEESPLFLAAHNNLAYLYESEDKIKKAITHWKIRATLGNDKDRWTILAKRKLNEYSGDKKGYFIKKEEKKREEELKIPEPNKKDLEKIQEKTALEEKYLPHPLIDIDREEAAVNFAEDIIREVQKSELKEKKTVAQKPEVNRHLVKGENYFKQSNFKKALSEFQQAYEVNPSKETIERIENTENILKARKYIRKGEEFYTNNDYEQAIKNFDQALELVPENEMLKRLAERVKFELCIDNAINFSEQKKYRPALENVNKALVLEPHDLQAKSLKEKIETQIKTKD